MRKRRLDREQKAALAFSLEAGAAVVLPSGRVAVPSITKTGLTAVVVKPKIQRPVDEGA